MSARDWSKEILTKDSPFSQGEMEELVNNLQKYVDPICTYSVEQCFRVYNNSYCRIFKYESQGQKVYVGFRDRSSAEHSQSRTTRLIFLSYDTHNVSTDEVIGLISRAIIEYVREAIRGEFSLFGPFLGVSVYARKYEERPVLLNVLQRVHLAIQDSLESTNYPYFINFVNETNDDVVKWDLLLKR